LFKGLLRFVLCLQCAFFVAKGDLRITLYDMIRHDASHEPNRLTRSTNGVQP